jgi:hypothetical protein
MAFLHAPFYEMVSAAAARLATARPALRAASACICSFCGALAEAAVSCDLAMMHQAVSTHRQHHAAPYAALDSSSKYLCGRDAATASDVYAVYSSAARLLL